MKEEELTIGSICFVIGFAECKGAVAIVSDYAFSFEIFDEIDTSLF